MYCKRLFPLAINFRCMKGMILSCRSEAKEQSINMLIHSYYYFEHDDQIAKFPQKGSLNNFLKIIASFTSVSGRLAEFADGEGNRNYINSFDFIWFAFLSRKKYREIFCQ